MAMLPIKPYGNPVLRLQSQRIEKVDDRIRQLVRDMTDTVRAAGGVGLAAPQVGESLMLFILDWGVIDENGKLVACINPVILESSSKLITQEEGCLSIPQTTAEVVRPDWIRVKYQTLDGREVTEELEELPARVFQHEFDHVMGILYIDRISYEARAAIKDNLQAIMDGRIKTFDGKSIPKVKEAV